MAHLVIRSICLGTKSALPPATVIASSVNSLRASMRHFAFLLLPLSSNGANPAVGRIKLGNEATAIHAMSGSAPCITRLRARKLNPTKALSVPATFLRRPVLENKHSGLGEKLKGRPSYPETSYCPPHPTLMCWLCAIIRPFSMLRRSVLVLKRRGDSYEYIDPFQISSFAYSHGLY